MVQNLYHTEFVGSFCIIQSEYYKNILLNLYEYNLNTTKCTPAIYINTNKLVFCCIIQAVYYNNTPRNLYKYKINVLFFVLFNRYTTNIGFKVCINTKNMRFRSIEVMGFCIIST